MTAAPGGVGQWPFGQPGGTLALPDLPDVPLVSRRCRVPLLPAVEDATAMLPEATEGPS